MSKDKRQQIFDKYNLLEGSELVHYQLAPNGVDCWFDTETHRQHRALLYPEFALFFPNVKWHKDYKPVEGDYANTPEEMC
jgi:hypothetical protein